MTKKKLPAPDLGSDAPVLFYTGLDALLAELAGLDSFSTEAPPAPAAEPATPAEGE